MKTAKFVMYNFKISNKGTLKLSETPMLKMLSYRQDDRKKTEAGGVLLGRFIKDSNDIILDRVTVPMIGDKRTRTSFKRGAKMHQRIIDHEWKKSKGTCHYIGEWHTHPENYPSPSSVDIKAWKEKLRNDTISNRYIYFIIVGIKGFIVLEGDKETLKFRKLKK